MLFRLGYFVDQLILSEGVNNLKFEYDGPHKILVELRSLTSEEGRSSLQIQKAACQATGVYNASEKILKYFQSLDENRYPGEEPLSELILRHHNGSLPEKLLKEYEEIYSKVENMPLEYFPEAFRSYVGQVRSELYDHVKKTINVFRWRYNKFGRHSPLFNGAMGWSFDGDNWKLVPQTISARFKAFAEPLIPENASQEVSTLVVQGHIEPLGHELYREALFQEDKNPRSAVIIGIAAVEVGIKECIGNLVPDSQWLVENLPSPPIISILQEYLPKLPVKKMIEGEIKPPPKRIIDLLRKGVTIRNNISHKGGPTPRHETVREILQAVKDILWLLDYYCGHEWAFEFISSKTKSELLNIQKKNS